MVRIHPHQEGAPVRVTEPRCDGRNIYPGFDCGRREGIAQIMMCQPFDPCFLARSCEGLSCLANAENLAARVNGWVAVIGQAGGIRGATAEPFEQRPGRRDQRNLPIRGFGLASANMQNAALEVHIGPSDGLGFAEPASRKGEEAAEIGRCMRRPAPVMLDFRKDFGKFCGFRQIWLPRDILELDPARVEGVSAKLPAFDGDIEYPAQGVDALVDERRRSAVVFRADRLRARGHKSGAFPAYSVSPLNDRLSVDAAGRQRSKSGPRLDDGIHFFVESAPSLGLDIHPVVNPLLVNGNKISGEDIPGRHVCQDLAGAFKFGSFVGQPKFRNRPDVGIQVEPFLLAGNREPSVISSTRVVP